jgi:polysaccharide chain length determinant protein (PEP-CTERM system associated)
MVDEFLDESSEKLRWEDFWAIVRRRRWLLVLPVFLGWALLWGVSWLLPAVYRSETLILVEQQKVPEQYVLPNVATDLQERLQSITQQILSRTRLQRIIQELHLYSKERARLSPDELVELMRKDIEITLVQAPRRDNVTAFKIFYSSSDSHTAQAVTNQLTSLFIDENLQARQQQSETTTGFLENQLEDARKILSGQEEIVRDFKGHYLGQLPGQLQSNLQIVSGLQTRMQVELEALSSAKQQKLYLESLLAQYRSIQAELRQGKGSAQLPAALDQELDRLKTQLTDFGARYTERYPDYRALKEQIAKTEKMKDEIAGELEAARNKAGQESNTSPTPTSYTELQAISPILEIESKLKANQLEMDNRQKQIERLEAQIAEYQARLNETPVREQQLADLTRDYDQSRANYESLLAKKNQSALATNLEKRQQGEQFRILDPPSLPDKPYWPDRFMLGCIGLLAGLLLGVGVTAGAELTDDRIQDEKDLKGLVPVSVLTEIPPLPTPREQRAQWCRWWLEWAGGTVMFATTVLGFVVTYYSG